MVTSMSHNDQAMSSNVREFRCSACPIIPPFTSSIELIDHLQLVLIFYILLLLYCLIYFIRTFHVITKSITLPSSSPTTGMETFPPMEFIPTSSSQTFQDNYNDDTMMNVDDSNLISSTSSHLWNHHYLSNSHYHNLLFNEQYLNMNGTTTIDNYHHLSMDDDIISVYQHDNVIIDKIPSIIVDIDDYDSKPQMTTSTDDKNDPILWQHEDNCFYNSVTHQES